MTEPNDKQKEEARELVRAWLLTSNPHHLIDHKDNLVSRIASALSARDSEIERLHGWQEGLAATTVTWSEQRLSRNREIREVLEGLRNPHRKVDDCWCNHDASDGSHSPACLATRALYQKVLP